jgi:hypothetical protein
MVRRDVRRRLEQYAANPGCEANVLSAVHDVPMEAVARELGLQPKVGQSVFAILRGLTFERALFQDDALRLRKALIDKKVLPANAAGFVDLRIVKNGGPCASLEASRQAFCDLLKRFAATTGEPRMQLPSVLGGPSLMVPGKAILPDGLFAADVVTVHPQPRPAPIVLRVGEIKVYPDRGGFTDATELSSTRAQAGLYVHVLRVELAQIGLEQHFVVADDGFLVLSRPGSNLPSVRAGEDLRYQADRAHEAFELLREAAAQALPLDGSGEAVPPKRLSIIQAANKAYRDGCLSFCELADHCQAEALSLGLPAALGEDMARFLGELSLHRALELLHGAKAASMAEEDFLRRTA